MVPVHPHFSPSRSQKTSPHFPSLTTPELRQRLEDLVEVEVQSFVDVANVVLLNVVAGPGSREPDKVEQAASSSIKTTIIVVVGVGAVVASAGEIMISHNEIVMLRSTSAQIGS